MKTSPNGLAIIKAFEGCLSPIKGRPGFFKPYLCPAKVLTIGWGHTNHHDPKFDQDAVWSQDQCDDGLRVDLRIFEDRVSRLAPEVKDQNRFDALVSWAYNTGGPSNSGVWPAAREGNKEVVKQRLSQWNKAKGKVLAGLTRRRKAEAELFEGNVKIALRTAGAIVHPMAQAVDVPVPPKELFDAATKNARNLRNAGIVSTGAGAGAEGSKAITEQPPTSFQFPYYVTFGAIGVGIALILIATVLISRKRARVQQAFA